MDILGLIGCENGRLANAPRMPTVLLFYVVISYVLLIINLPLGLPVSIPIIQ